MSNLLIPASRPSWEVVWYLLRFKLKQRIQNALLTRSFLLPLPFQFSRPFLESHISSYILVGHYITRQRCVLKRLLLDTLQSACFSEHHKYFIKMLRPFFSVFRRKLENKKAVSQIFNFDFSYWLPYLLRCCS